MPKENEKEKIIIKTDSSKKGQAQTNKKNKKDDDSEGPLEFLKSIAIALLIAILIKTFIMDATNIAGNSMLNTLHNGDMLLMNKLSKNFTDYHRGQIVILKAPDYPNRLYVKRVIGEPGDTITLKDEKVYVNGEELNEPYTSVDYTLQTSEDYEWTLLDNQYFVMGDNRLEGASNDSRNFGSIDKSEIVGHAFFRIYPFNDIGKIDNNPYGNE
ncbi:signal peptidase I [uncultured Anaerococcus sp.]|uniref:signal peptidase I n=1 Tax=uncultured Anaerococcus sp. TaxID=293428 RepID=UPI00260E44E0|nr:signal peptidase I [uncultured Anaerococcus sp.]